jgi:hypothetical protein
MLRRNRVETRRGDAQVEQLDMAAATANGGVQAAATAIAKLNTKLCLHIKKVKAPLDLADVHAPRMHRCHDGHTPLPSPPWCHDGHTAK